jgi:hypothetical protein
MVIGIVSTPLLMMVAILIALAAWVGTGWHNQ